MANTEMTGRSVAEPSTVATRRRDVVDAFVDLMLATGTPPAPEDVAASAGVSRATFFRYFASLDEFRNEVSARVIERFPELFSLPEADVGPLEDRIQRFVDARFELHETLHAFELLGRAHAVRDPASADRVDAVRTVQADQVRNYFEADLAAHGPARCDDIAAAIAVLTSVESWEQFRRSHGRSPLQTRRAWRGALAGILCVS
ncbi:MAG: TetR/AcrR family transcriptional regulator [Actinomycetota bacterium]